MIKLLHPAISFISLFFAISLSVTAQSAVDAPANLEKKIILAQELIAKIGIKKAVDAAVAEGNETLTRPFPKNGDPIIDKRNQLIKSKILAKINSPKEDISLTAIKKISQEMATMFSEDELKYWLKSCENPSALKMLSFLVSDKLKELIFLPRLRAAAMIIDTRAEVMATEKTKH